MSLPRANRAQSSSKSGDSPSTAKSNLKTYSKSPELSNIPENKSSPTKTELVVALNREKLATSPKQPTPTPKITSAMEIVSSSDDDDRNANQPPDPNQVDAKLWSNFTDSWETNKIVSAVNVKEYIVFLIDAGQDTDFTPFRLGDDTLEPLEMLKRGVHTFLNVKALLPGHEFALAVLEENDVRFLHNFTNDTQSLKRTLSKINPCPTKNALNFNQVFDDLFDFLPIGQSGNSLTRVIMMYSRSYAMPSYTESLKMKEVFESPRFILDILMTHEPVGPANNCDKIFKKLCSLDQKGLSYFLPVTRNAMRFHLAIGRLIGHPYQRPLQCPAQDT